MAHPLADEVKAREAKFFADTYQKQRRDRLADAVGDYLTCEETDARQCYEEMLAEVDSWVEYHQKNMEKALALKRLLLGERFVDKFPERY